MLLDEISGIKDGRIFTRDAETDDIDSLTKEKYDRLVKEGHLEPSGDFFGSRKNLVEVRWATSGKRAVISVGDATESSKVKELREAISIAEKAGNQPYLVKRLENELRNELGSSTIRVTYDDFDDQERLKVLRNNLEAAKKSDPQEAKELQKEIDNLEAEMARKNTKDGGPGSGQEGHKTAPKKNSVSFLQNLAKQGYIELEGDPIPGRHVSVRGPGGKRSMILVEHDTTDGGPGSGQKGHKTSQRTGGTRNQKGKKRGWMPSKFAGRKALLKKRLAKIHESKDSLSFSPEEAKSIGEKAGVDFSKIDLEQFRMGLEVEQEHNDVTGGDPEKIAQIVLAHLQEDKEYYTKLKKMETKDCSSGKDKLKKVLLENK